MSNHPLVLLEINEVPWRLIDHYRLQQGFPNIKRFFEQAHCFTTRAVDTGELSPWVTWPTLHRGMNNEAHKVRNLGQDPNTFCGTPIWEEFRKAGASIGVCGAMQSWPPVDPGANGFFVPDTFAHDSQCFPSSLAPFQAFNLGQVKKNPRVLSRSSIGLIEGLKVARSALSSGVRMRTLFRIAEQLVAERLDPSKLARRPIFQTVLFWDIFCKLFNLANPPAYSSFFTNHVAGIMHRYWRDVFPEDFPAAANSSEHTKENTNEHTNEPTMRFALSVLDDMLGDVLEWSRRHPNIIFVFAASMGQGPVYRHEHEGKEIIVSDLSKLMNVIGLSSEDYVPLLAMVPQVAVEISDKAKRQHAIIQFSNCRTMLDEPFIKTQEIGATLSITVATSNRAAIDAGKFILGDTEITWEAAGIHAIDIEPGTGYHIPEGVLAFLSGKSRGEGEGAHHATDHRAQLIRADAVKDWLMRIAKSGAAQIDNPPLSPIEAITPAAPNV